MDVSSSEDLKKAVLAAQALIASALKTHGSVIFRVYPLNDSKFPSERQVLVLSFDLDFLIFVCRFIYL